MVYDSPYFVEYRHVIYRWKALELIFKVSTLNGEFTVSVLQPGLQISVEMADWVDSTKMMLLDMCKILVSDFLL